VEKNGFIDTFVIDEIDFDEGEFFKALLLLYKQVENAN
jgi:hypothetical protein